MRAPLPIIPGHEAVGSIVILGEGRTHDCSGQPLKIGDRIMWAHVPCGDCYYCTITHQPRLCTQRYSYGYSSSGSYPYLTGAFSEYEYVVPHTEVV